MSALSCLGLWAALVQEWVLSFSLSGCFVSLSLCVDALCTLRSCTLGEGLARARLAFLLFSCEMVGFGRFFALNTKFSEFSHFFLLINVFGCV